MKKILSESILVLGIGKKASIALSIDAEATIFLSIVQYVGLITGSHLRPSHLYQQHEGDNKR